MVPVLGRLRGNEVGLSYKSGGFGMVCRVRILSDFAVWGWELWVR